MSIYGTESEVRYMGDKDDWDDRIERQNEKIIHFLWIIFVSMITSIITTILSTM